MDAARTARRLVPDGEVTLVYRRTRAEMPAEAGELLDCIAEGVGLRDLLAPVRVVVEGGQVGRPRLRPHEARCSRRIGPAAAGCGRRRRNSRRRHRDRAIGQEPVLDFLGGLDLARRRDGTLVVDAATCETSVTGLFAGGDVARGAASVIKAIADGRAVATEIARRHGIEPTPEPALDKQTTVAALMGKKARRAQPQTVPVLPLAERSGFAEVVGAFGPDAAATEASRCLDCDEVCSLCVTVCPNRANLAYASSPFHVTWPS